MSQRFQITRAAELESLGIFRDFITEWVLNKSDKILSETVLIGERRVGIVNGAIDHGSYGLHERAVDVWVHCADLAVQINFDGTRLL